MQPTNSTTSTLRETAQPRDRETAVPRYDVAIVGAGAAGLMAAIAAGRTARERGARLRIAAIDGAKRIGAKILISGGGRCNITNEVVGADAFNGSRNAIAKVLRSGTFQSAVGPLTYDAKGDIKDPVYDIYVWKDGKSTPSGKK